MKKVLIVGGGFAGIHAAKSIAKLKHFEVTLLDRRNYHLFQPLLYQVAMSGLSPAEISSPIRSIFSKWDHLHVLLGNVENLDLSKRLVRTDFAEFHYDYLVLACGAQHSYFGHDEWEEYAPGLKTIEQATEIRRRILLSFEQAERETNPEIQKELLTFVVVGGGPTGVELAGAIGELSRFTLAKDFSHIDPSGTRIVLIEAGPRILASFSEGQARYAARDLESLGVTIRTNSRVTDINPRGVAIAQEFIAARTVLWAAGVAPSPLNVALGAKLDRHGRVVVREDMSLPDHPEVFVLGDQACFLDKDQKPLPGLAPVAIQQGDHVARILKADLEGRPRPPFHYFDKGQLATIGRLRAIGEVGKWKFRGFFAWIVWLFVHIYFLIGFKNRFFVFLEWAWLYLTYQRGARLILSREWRSHRDFAQPPKTSQ